MLRNHAPFAGHPAHRLKVGLDVLSGCQRVLTPFAGQKWPASSDPREAVERESILGLTIAVTGVAVPDRTVLGVYFERRIDDTHGIANARVVGAAESQPDEFQEAGAYDLLGRPLGIVRWTVLDRDPRSRDARAARHFRRGDPDVVALDIDPAGEFGVGDVGPVFDAGVPGVGQFERVAPGRLIQEPGGADERGDLDRECKRA